MLSYYNNNSSYGSIRKRFVFLFDTKKVRHRCNLEISKTWEELLCSQTSSIRLVKRFSYYFITNTTKIEFIFLVSWKIAFSQSRHCPFAMTIRRTYSFRSPFRGSCTNLKSIRNAMYVCYRIDIDVSCNFGSILFCVFRAPNQADFTRYDSRSLASHDRFLR